MCPVAPSPALQPGDCSKTLPLFRERPLCQEMRCTQVYPAPARWRIRLQAGAGDSQGAVTGIALSAGAVQVVPSIPQSWQRAWGSGCGAGLGGAAPHLSAEVNPPL